MKTSFIKSVIPLFLLSVSFALSSVVGATIVGEVYYPNQSAASLSAMVPTVTGELESSLKLVGGTDLVATKDQIFLAWSSYDTTLTGSKYLQVSISATVPGDTFTLSELYFVPRNFLSRPGQIEVRFSETEAGFANNDYITVFHTPDNNDGRYKAGSGSYDAVNNPGFTIDLTSVSEMPESISEGFFRIYIYDVWDPNKSAPDAGAWNGIQDLKITTTISVIPEPAAAGILFGGLTLGYWLVSRRRLRSGAC